MPRKRYTPDAEALIDRLNELDVDMPVMTLIHGYLSGAALRGTEGLDVLVMAVRDWMQFGAGDGTYDAEAESERLLRNIAKAYERLGAS